MATESTNKLFKRLKLIINRIEEVANEDSYSVVSLGVLPAVGMAKTEISRIENEIEKLSVDRYRCDD